MDIKRITTLVLFLLLSSLLHPQEIRIKTGGYIKVPTGQTLHVKDHLMVEDGCAMHSHGVLKVGGNLINIGNKPWCIDTGRLILEGNVNQKIVGDLLFDNLIINNQSGVSLNHNITINKTLSLLTGNLVLGNYNLKLEENAVIAGNPSNNSMVVATGTGQIRRQITTPGTFSFPVGDQTGGSDFTPVILSFSSGVFGSNSFIGVNLVNAKYPDPNIQNNYLKRYWTITSNDISGFVCNAQFYYKTTDVTGIESKLYCQQVVPPPLAVFAPADTMTHALSANGLTGFGTFTGAEAPCYSLSAATSVINQVSCFGGSNGSATVNATGGIGSYTYQWSTIPVQTTQTAVGLPAGNYTVLVTDALGCIKPSNVIITQPPQWWAALYGPSTECQNTQSSIYTTDAGMASYVWNVSSGGLITSGGSGSNNWVIVKWINAGVQNVRVSYTNSAGCSPFEPTIMNVTVNPLPVPAIAGPTSVCALSEGNVYITQPGMSGYTWNLSPGGTITSGSGTNAITVTWSGTGGQNVSVNYTNLEGCPAPTPVILPVTVNPLPVPTLNGSPTACAGTIATYATQPGMNNYLWSVSSGGTVTGGGTPGSNTITITWVGTGPQSVSVNYSDLNGCSATLPATHHLTVNPTPLPSITSPDIPCANNTPADYYTQTGMNTYVWSVTNGGTIISGQGTPHVQVGWTIPGPETVYVSYTNTYGCPTTTPANFPVIVSPLPSEAGVVSGPSTVCAGDLNVAYSIPPIPFATSYYWHVPSGATITSGSGTNSIVVSFSTTAISGNITVVGQNVCGNGTVSPDFPVTVSGIPEAAGLINGPTNICIPSDGHIYSILPIADATNYNWTLPFGAVITNGVGTHVITVSFAGNSTAGQVSVFGMNACGSGTASPPLSITTQPTPDTPVITNNNDTLTSSSSLGNQWYYEGYQIQGANSQTYVAAVSGWYWTVVTLNNCSSETSNHVYVLITSVDELPLSYFKVYPIPNEGSFTVSVITPDPERFRIYILNKMGQTIYELPSVDVNGKFEKLIDLKPLPNGIYTVVFENSKHTIIRKVLVNK